MIDFLKYRYVCFVASFVIIVIGVFAYIVKGGFKYHIDFVGGAELRIAFEKKLEVGQLRNAISEKGWKDSIIQSVGSSGKEFIVKIGGSIEGVEDKFKKDVSSVIPDNKITIENIDWVGAEVDKDIRKNAIVAVLLSLLLILLYISVMRSKLSYAVGAVVALAHDMLIVLVCFLLLNEQISLQVLAAILAMLGYSLNDTIVIFSRIRENITKMKDVPLLDIVNISINQTLKRTLLTSFSTLLAVGSFFIIGGETLRGFSLAMLIGIVVGTYSSVYIASPVMLMIDNFSKSKSQ